MINQGSEITIIEENIKKKNGDVDVRQYERGKLLGKGGLCRCYEIKSIQSQKLSAVKIITKSSLQRAFTRKIFIQEIKLHKSLQHQNIVNFEHVFEDSKNVYVLLELCSNQTLIDLIKRRKHLQEIEAQYYIRQIIQALKYLHSKNIVHGLLKLNNIYLNDQMQIKLGNFKYAIRLDIPSDVKCRECNYVNYAAPEILEGQQQPSKATDIWQIGIILYTLLIGRLPFETYDLKITYKKIRLINYSFPDNISISENARNLIKQIFVLNPEQRPTPSQILEHPFLSSNSIPQVLPISTLACALSENHLQKQGLKEQYQQQQIKQKIKTLSQAESVIKKTFYSKDQIIKIQGVIKQITQQQLASLHKQNIQLQKQKSFYRSQTAQNIQIKSIPKEDQILTIDNNN